MLQQQETVVSGVSTEINLLEKIEIGPLGGIVNVDAIVAMCPQEFLDEDNPWTVYARQLCMSAVCSLSFFQKLSEPSKECYIPYLRNALRVHSLAQESKEALIGWILKEILRELPKRPN